MMKGFNDQKIFYLEDRKYMYSGQTKASMNKYFKNLRNGNYKFSEFCKSKFTRAR